MTTSFPSSYKTRICKTSSEFQEALRLLSTEIDALKGCIDADSFEMTDSLTLKFAGMNQRVRKLKHLAGSINSIEKKLLSARLTQNLVQDISKTLRVQLETKVSASGIKYMPPDYNVTCAKNNLTTYDQYYKIPQLVTYPEVIQHEREYNSSAKANLSSEPSFAKLESLGLSQETLKILRERTDHL